MRLKPGSAVRVLDSIIVALIAFFYAGIVVAMFAQVVFRYVLGSPLSWSEEVSRYMFVWLCYLGAYVAVIRNSHVGVDYLTRRFSPAAKRVIDTIFHLAIIAALGLVAYEGAVLTLDNVVAEWSTLPFLSMALAYLAVPAGAVLMIFGFLRLLFFGAAAAAEKASDEAAGL